MSLPLLRERAQKSPPKFEQRSPLIVALHSFEKTYDQMIKPDPVIVGSSALLGEARASQDVLFNVPAAPTLPDTPLNPFQAYARGPATTGTSRKSGKRKQTSGSLKRRVLVVDDVPDVTEMIGLFLKHAGYEVATADSAMAALRLTYEKAFDVIISDIGMPEMNGYELAESLRRRAEYQCIPIIAVTGYSEYDDRGRAMQSGFNAHLTKPIDPDELLHLMNELLG